MNISRIVTQVCCITVLSASAASASNKFSIVDKLYLRVGGGAMWARTFKDDKVYEKKAPKIGPIYFAGIGYKYNDSIRGELDVQYGLTHYKFRSIVPASLEFSEQMDLRSQKIKTYAVVLNGYYDINFNKPIVPYVTAGIGVAKTKAGKLSEILGDAEYYILTNHLGKSKTNFAWNAGFGAKVDITKKLGFDIGYRWADYGKISTYSIYKLSTVTQKLRGQQVVAALIYSF